MNKKKLATMIVAGSLAVGLLGGSLAWFTSSDKVLNKFATVQDENNEGDSGIDIYEKFDGDKAQNVLPGGPKVDKYVQVKNTAKYAQLIRVKLIPEWSEETMETFANNDIVPANQAIKLDLGKKEEKKWRYNEDDGYYYFLEKVAPSGFTTNILEKVSLDSTLDNKYKNAKFNVKVVAEAVQAADDPDDGVNPVDEWNILDEGLKEELKALTNEDKIAFEGKQTDGAVETKKQKDSKTGEVQEYSEYKMGTDREEV